jgi:hypothetical protein
MSTICPKNVDIKTPGSSSTPGVGIILWFSFGKESFGVLLGGLSAIPPEEVMLAAAAVEYHTEEAIGRGPVGGDVGVEVLIDERAGGKAPADAQEGARRVLAVGRGVLARDVLDQARAPVHGVRAPRAHGAAKLVDARVLGPDMRVRIGGSSGILLTFAKTKLCSWQRI